MKFQIGFDAQGSKDIGISIVEQCSTDIPVEVIMQLFEAVDDGNQ